MRLSARHMVLTMNLASYLSGIDPCGRDGASPWAGASPAVRNHICTVRVPRCVDEAACPLTTLAVALPTAPLCALLFAPRHDPCCSHPVTTLAVRTPSRPLLFAPRHDPCRSHPSVHLSSRRWVPHHKRDLKCLCNVIVLLGRLLLLFRNLCYSVNTTE